jgi:hypothetical protein
MAAGIITAAGNNTTWKNEFVAELNSVTIPETTGEANEIQTRDIIVHAHAFGMQLF